jgi:hypothetical protein
MSMAWKMNYVPERAAVTVVVTGEIRNDDARARTMEIAGLLNRHQTKNVLLDCSEALAEMSLPELYWLADAAAELQLPWDLQVAVVLPRTRYRIDAYEFFALVFRNAGYEVRLFEDREVAEEWLAPAQKVPARETVCARA